MFNAFRQPNHTDQTWHQFECKVVEETIAALEPLGLRVKHQHGGAYRSPDGGRVLYVDIHVAEPRQGGRGLVIDAKHFTVAPLNRNELESAEDYRRQMRAGLAIVATSSTTVIPASVERCADAMDRLLILPVDRGYARALKRISKQLLEGAR